MSRPRARRAVKVALAAVAGIAVSLTALVLVGNHFRANTLPGQKVVHGRTGAEVYLRNCVLCHGRNGEGGNGAIKGPAFTPGGPLASLTFDQRVEKIGRGKPLRGMPRWKQGLSDDEIRMVAAYTQLLSGQEPQPGVEDVH